MKSKDLQLRLLYVAKLPFKIKSKIKSFPDKKKQKEFDTTKPVLQEMLKGLLVGGGGGRERGRRRRQRNIVK